MMIPKTAKLKNEESQADSGPEIIQAPKACGGKKNCTGECDKEYLIKEVNCLNDFVAILRFEEDSLIEIPDKQRLKNEGIVIGVGPGVPPTEKSQIIIGDIVAFLPRNIVTEIKGTAYPYEGKNIAIVSERNIIMKLEPLPHRFV